MPATDAARDAADRIASEHTGPDAVAIYPNAGPRGDRMIVSFPSGGQVVVGPEGDVLADSRPHRVEDELDGYRPGEDVLLVESCDDETILIPPWRCAMSCREHLPPEATLELLEELRRWHANIIREGVLRVWQLPLGERELRRVE